MPDVEAHITGTVWKIEATPGTSVQAGDAIIILESMKMEMPVESPVKGTVKEVKVAEGQPVNEGALVAIVDEG